MHQTPSPPSCDLLITADLCLTQDAGRRIIEDCAVAVLQGRVLAVGPRSDLAHYLAREHLHLGPSLLMPGLVNAHTHAAMVFLRGLGDDLPLDRWLRDLVFPVEKHLSAEMVEIGSLLGCAEMLRTGTTAFADMYLIEDAVIRAVECAGLRAVLGEAVFAFPSPAYKATDEAFALVREQAQRHAGHPLIRIAVMPHAEYTTSPDILERARALAGEYDLPLQIHLAETFPEVERCRQERGMSPTAYLESLGFLSPAVSLAHCVVMDDADLQRVAASGAHVAHCPRSNMKLASGVARVPEMLAMGIPVALGTDGAASNNSLNMFAEMSACSLVHKVHGMNPTLCPATAVLDMATRRGAAALGLEGAGEIAPGAPADMIALDLRAPGFMPLHDPVSALVYAASGHEVRMNMVAGRILYQDGLFHTLDQAVLGHEAKKLKAWVLSRR